MKDSFYVDIVTHFPVDILYVIFLKRGVIMKNCKKRMKIEVNEGIYIPHSFKTRRGDSGSPLKLLSKSGEFCYLLGLHNGKVMQNL